MQHKDEIAVRNAAHWEEAVENGTGHSIPWLDLNLDELRRYIQGDLGEVKIVGRKDPRRMVNLSPLDIRVLGNVDGKELLCLSYGGGQQSALFTLLGANVTVVDFSQGQLAADQKAANHFGYEIRTIHADMRDLSCLETESFDIVFGTATCYVPSIREVYSEVTRILKPDGIYRTDVSASTREIEKNTVGNRISPFYAETEIRNDYGGVHEFRHYLDDIFTGLSDNGLRLLQADDGKSPIEVSPDASPASWKQWPNFRILARKE